MLRLMFYGLDFSGSVGYAFVLVSCLLFIGVLGVLMVGLWSVMLLPIVLHLFNLFLVFSLLWVLFWLSCGCVCDACFVGYLVVLVFV